MTVTDATERKPTPSLAARVRLAALAPLGRLNYLRLNKLRFRGAYGSLEEARAAVRPDALAGYDHDAVAEISEETMSQVLPWDYPVLYWLRDLISSAPTLIDAGGHLGVKYRAFKRYLAWPESLRWIVYDLPSIVRAGRARAQNEGLGQLEFIDDLGAAPASDILLASGLLQYLDMPLGELLGRLVQPPRHLILNKVALREGPLVVTLENFGLAEVPYQIRPRAAFFAEIDALGYDVVDQWTVPSFAHVIPTHPELGASSSVGLYARRRGAG